jgi:predicted Zn-dependent peptidase
MIRQEEFETSAHGSRAGADAGLDRDTTVATLANGVRVVAIELPHLGTASVSVFVRTGSRHEPAAMSGVSHFVEHMAFKGTQTRDCRQINLDGERLGAEVNAHTDKDHTAYHMQGLAAHAGQFVRLLGDIVQNSTFPADELDREREVILQEFLEDSDDALSSAYKLFDQACFGDHPVARPVIGTRDGIERLSRDDLLSYVGKQYSGSNVVVGVAGNVDPAEVVAEVERVFGGMPVGAPNALDAPAYLGGSRLRRLPGNSQSHVVLGFPLPNLRDDYHAAVVAAALFGEGMSSPLMHEIRERRGLVYFAACSADINDVSGQFVIEASTTPEHLDEFFAEVGRLLLEHAEKTDDIGLERARNQIAVRMLRAQEHPSRRLEDAAQDLFVYGRVRSRDELVARIEAVTGAQVRAVFQTMLAAPVSIAVAGKVGKATSHRFLDILQQKLGAPAPAGVAAQGSLS